MSPTWSCGLVPGRCRQPCRSRKLRVPWPYKACMPPRPWPWPLHHAARRTVPSSDVSWARPTPWAHGRGKGSGWFQGRLNRCPLPLLVYVSSSGDLSGWACHPGWDHSKWVGWKERDSYVYRHILGWVVTNYNYFHDYSTTVGCFRLMLYYFWMYTVRAWVLDFPSNSVAEGLAMCLATLHTSLEGS